MCIRYNCSSLVVFGMATKGNFASDVDTPSTATERVDGATTVFEYAHPSLRGGAPLVLRGAARDSADASLCTGLTAWFGARNLADWLLTPSEGCVEDDDRSGGGGDGGRWRGAHVVELGCGCAR